MRYSIPKIDGITFDEDRVNDFGKLAEELGLSDAQFTGIVTKVAMREAHAEQQTNFQHEQEMRDAEASLRKEWGTSYDQNIALAKANLKQEGISTATVGNDVNAIKYHARQGRERQLAASVSKLEDATAGAINANGTGPTAAFQGNDIISNNKNPKHAAYYNPRDPNHAAVASEVSQLFAIGYPDPVASSAPADATPAQQPQPQSAQPTQPGV